MANEIRSKDMEEKIKNLKKNITIIKQGSTSSSYTSPFLFIKYLKSNTTTHKSKRNLLTYDIFKREKYIGSVLNKFDWFPTLLYSDDENLFFIYKNKGVPVNYKNIPQNIEEQFNKILSDLKTVNIQHNDIKESEILVDQKGKIYLCDFGWGSVNNDLSCGIGIWGCNNKNKPGGYRDDETALKRCDFKK